MRLVTRMLLVSLLWVPVYAEVVNKIQVEGLEHISLKTLRSYLPIKEGEHIDATRSSEAIRVLYRTGFFSDVKLAWHDATLVVTVVERAVVSEIKVTGNKHITKKQIVDALKVAGLAEGKIFDHAVLVNMEQELIQQYRNLGYYNARVNTKIEDAKGRVDIFINISEGALAKIKELKIVGNEAFSQRKLLKEFTSKTWSLFSHADQYSRAKLDADVEKLRSFYLDRGYLKFKIDDVKVKMSDDQQAIFITVQITEGDVYRLGGFAVAGTLPVAKTEIMKLITLKNGETFSRKSLFEISNNIGHFLGNFGYAAPSINAEPVLDETQKTVFINFVIDVGNRTYVRRINFFGNTRTNESVLRREMRQQEGALFAVDKLEESKRRLENLGYLQNIEVKMEGVSEHPEQVDINYTLKEASSAMANFQVGYSDADGFIYGVNINEQNLLGTGNALGIGFDNSKDYKTYNLTFTNPYFTESGISMRLNGYAQHHTPGSVNLSSYTTDAYGTSVIWGIPLSDYNRLHLGGGYEKIKLGTNSGTSQEVLDFITVHGNVFNQLRLLAGWSYSNTDRALFPTQGTTQVLNIEVGVPLDSNSLEYYKADYILSWYLPITKQFVLKARGEVGYGDGYGSTKELPFFKNYFSGGIGSVRGFEPGSLGPRDSKDNPKGANLLTDGSLALIFPNPAGESLRTSAFVDLGQVYHDRFCMGDLRSSYGVQAEWRSPLGILVFSFAKPLKSRAGDKMDAFQFNIGTSF